MKFISSGIGEWRAQAIRFAVWACSLHAGQGQNVVAVIEQSIERGWTGLFAVKSAQGAAQIPAPRKIHRASNHRGDMQSLGKHLGDIATQLGVKL